MEQPRDPFTGPAVRPSEPRLRPGGRSRRWAAALILAGLLGALVTLTRVPQRDRPGTPPSLALPLVPAATLPAPRPQDPVAALYRWRDERGALHLASEPPEGIAAEVIPLTRPPGLSRPVVEPSSPSATLVDEPLRVYTPGGLEELAERLGETWRRLEDRDRMLEDLQRELRP